MGNEIAVELVALVEETEWMGFGISGSTTRTFMLGADPTVVDMYNGTFRARDFYLINRSQCSGVSGVCPDTRNGSTDDVKVGSVSGERDQGITLVRYKRPLTPSDVNDTLPSDRRIDRSIPVGFGVSTYIVWAIGPVSPDTGLPQFHTVYPRGLDFQLEFGRVVKDNCSPLASNVTVTPPVPYEIPVLKDVKEIVARIGPSGGDRVRIYFGLGSAHSFCSDIVLIHCCLLYFSFSFQGYSAITNSVSWGIAWYLNDLLIPVVEMRRGTTYRFRISGGNTPNSNSEYHPMYLTTSSSGGYVQMTPSERAQQTVLAGINVTQRDSDGNVLGFDSPLQAPICLYQVTDATFNLPKTGTTYQDYYNTLDRSCASNSSITNAAAILEFTPTVNTPNVIYYQCVTHRNLGWKINVLDALTTPVAVPIIAPTPASVPARIPVRLPTPIPVQLSVPLPVVAVPIIAPTPASVPARIPVRLPTPIPVQLSVPLPVAAPARGPTPPIPVRVPVPVQSAPLQVAAPVFAPASIPVKFPVSVQLLEPVPVPVLPISVAVPVSVPVVAPSPTKSPIDYPLATTPVTMDLPLMTDAPVSAPIRALCGIFGLNIFCPGQGECGFFRRVFGIGGC
jgi:hypothetical protein